jgi:hypothetical protein
MDNISPRYLQAHCQSRTSPSYNQSFVKELAKPTQKQKKFLKMPHRTTKRQMRVSKIGHANHGRQGSTGGNS